MYIFSVNFWIPILYTAYRFGDMEIGMIVFIYHDSIFGDVKKRLQDANVVF